MGSIRRETETEKTDGPIPSDARGVPYRERSLGPVAWVSRKSAKARRAIMPRCALSPVWASRRSIERSSCANRSTGIRRLTMVEGAPGGRPAFFCGVAALDGGLLPSWACLGCRGAVGIVDSSVQGCRAWTHLVYYNKTFL